MAMSRRLPNSGAHAVRTSVGFPFHTSGMTKVDEMILTQYRQALVTGVKDAGSESDANFTKAQSDLDESCKMDVGSQALRVAVGAVVAPFSAISRGLEQAKDEPTAAGKAISIITAPLGGVSLESIRQNGIFGGPNSFFRKPFG
jgi:hypothetical protein